MGVRKTVIFSHSGNLQDYVKACGQDILWDIIQKHTCCGAKILEAGAGSGRWLAFLTDQGYKMVGIELNEESVKRFAEYYPDTQYDLGDVTALPYPDGEFDGVLSLGVLEHFVDGPELALKEMKRVLKDGEVAIISVPFANLTWNIEKLKDRIYYQLFSSNSIRKLFKKKPIAYNNATQKQYFDDLSAHLIQGLDFKFQFTPSGGIQFYEYRFQVQQFLELIRQNDFQPVEVYLEYADQRLYQVFGPIVGKYTPGKGVTLNLLGKVINKLIPKPLTAHMIIAVARKAHQVRPLR